MSENSIITILLWGLGACGAGFIFLFKRIWDIGKEMTNFVSKSWLEDHFEKSLNEKFEFVNGTLGQIKEALVGSFKEKGILTKIDEINKRCGRNHPEDE